MRGAHLLPQMLSGTSRYDTCERACSKAKAARKEQRDEEEAREAKREAEIQAEIQKNVQLRAKRLAAAADAAGLENEASILISEYGRGLTVGKLRDWAAGTLTRMINCIPVP